MTDEFSRPFSHHGFYPFPLLLFSTRCRGSRNAKIVVRKNTARSAREGHFYLSGLSFLPLLSSPERDAYAKATGER